SMRLRMPYRTLRAPARRSRWSALALSAVSGVAAIALVLTSGAPSGTASSGLSLSKHDQTAVTHFRLAANATATPPTLPAGQSARAALLGVQSDLGQQLSLATWGIQTSPAGTGNLNAV